jgi:hypothetical protein
MKVLENKEKRKVLSIPFVSFFVLKSLLHFQIHITKVPLRPDMGFRIAL